MRLSVQSADSALLKGENAFEVTLDHSGNFNMSNIGQRLRFPIHHAANLVRSISGERGQDRLHDLRGLLLVQSFFRTGDSDCRTLPRSGIK